MPISVQGEHVSANSLNRNDLGKANPRSYPAPNPASGERQRDRPARLGLAFGRRPLKGAFLKAPPWRRRHHVLENIDSRGRSPPPVPQSVPINQEFCHAHQCTPQSQTAHGPGRRRPGRVHRPRPLPRPPCSTTAPRWSPAPCRPIPPRPRRRPPTTTFPPTGPTARTRS